MNDKFIEGWLARGEASKCKEKCGDCIHSDNELGFLSLRCDLLEVEDDFNKVRSWNSCRFKPSKFEKRKEAKE